MIMFMWDGIDINSIVIYIKSSYNVFQTVHNKMIDMGLEHIQREEGKMFMFMNDIRAFSV